MAPVKKVPRWDDDPEHGTPECCLHWRGWHDHGRVEFWIGHPDRLRLEQEEDGTCWLYDLWTGESQRLRMGCLIVVEKGGRAVVV